MSRKKVFRCLKNFLIRNAGDELSRYVDWEPGLGHLYATGASVIHPLLWPWAQRWQFREGPRFFTANRCINIFSYLALSGGRNVQEG